MTDLKEIMKKEKVIIGTERTIKAMKNNKVKNVLISNNCNELTKKEIIHLAKISDIKVEILSVPNQEVGLLCKKPFAISVLSY
ncbi:ribosomal L7Ae/L30e/S12e/Gadd45 family protein [Candidatus Woesearchaeota archaeon]|nr:ribosomal L7Ae/L30e/S12e/Gadd45 family protein [Candidatus Woesearchaeota archaeon]